MPHLHKVDHPLAEVAITQLRSVGTDAPEFRRRLRELSALVFLEATRHLPLEPITVQTPLAQAAGARLTRPLVLAPVLRAALGMVDGVWPMAPDAQVAHLGIYRDEKTAMPRPYYSKFPKDLRSAHVFALDPMLATGQSAIEAVKQLKAADASQITFLCLIACRPGLKAFQNEHPDVPVFTAAIDPELNERFYILPGLGDAGDRYFGT